MCKVNIARMLLLTIGVVFMVLAINAHDAAPAALGGLWCGAACTRNAPRLRCNHADRRLVHLARFEMAGGHGPSIERWKSFGWTVLY